MAQLVDISHLYQRLYNDRSRCHMLTYGMT